MPKQKIKKKSRLDDAVDGLYKKCRYCNCSKPTRRFDLHQVACKLRWKISREQKDLFSLASADPQSQQSNAMPVDVEFQEGCSAVPMELDPLENGSPGEGVEQGVYSAFKVDFFNTNKEFWLQTWFYNPNFPMNTLKSFHIHIPVILQPKSFQSRHPPHTSQIQLQPFNLVPNYVHGRHLQIFLTSNSLR